MNGPFQDTLSRNTFRQPGLFYQNTALLKTFPLPREGTRLQFRAELYNIFNHSNLYVNAGLNAGLTNISSTDVSTASFTTSNGDFVPGVTASFRDNRQIVLALKLIF